MEDYARKQNCELNQIFELKIKMYKSSLDVDVNFDRKDLLEYLNIRHKTEKEKITKEFIDETSLLKNKANQTKFK